MRPYRKRIRLERASPQEQFEDAIGLNKISLVRELIKNPEINPAFDRNWSIRYACHNGFYTIVKILLNDNRTDPTDFLQVCVKYASEHGYSRILKLLLKDKRVDPTDDESYTFLAACSEGHFECVKILLKDGRINPIANNYEAFIKADLNLHKDIVILLSKHKKIRYRYDLVFEAAQRYFNLKDYNTLDHLLYGKIKSMLKEKNKEAYKLLSIRNF